MTSHPNEFHSIQFVIASSLSGNVDVRGLYAFIRERRCERFIVQNKILEMTV